jgi:CheY-like chemotaxis protein
MVEGLVKEILKHQHEVWIDFQSIPGGAQWEVEITRAIDKTEVCVAVVTPESIHSPWVKKEIGLAREKNKAVIPIILHEIPIPEGLETLGIADLQCIDFDQYGYIGGLERLLKVLPEVKSSENDVVYTDKRALIIEDIAAQQTAIAQVLKAMGITITVAQDLDSALICIRDEKFDAITLDMQLDVMDAEGQHGILLLNQIRSYQRNVPVIIISALDWTGSEVRKFLRKHGAFDYLKKPFYPDELTSIIKDALEQRK